MKLFRIILPNQTNEGAAYTEAHYKFQEYVVDKAGGFTQTDVRGAWRAPNGKLHQEDLQAYDVACDPDAWQRILTRAYDLFDDQQSIFHAYIGEANFIDGKARDPAPTEAEYQANFDAGEDYCEDCGQPIGSPCAQC